MRHQGVSPSMASSKNICGFMKQAGNAWPLSQSFARCGRARVSLPLAHCAATAQRLCMVESYAALRRAPRPAKRLAHRTLPEQNQTPLSFGLRKASRNAGVMPKFKFTFLGGIGLMNHFA